MMGRVFAAGAAILLLVTADFLVAAEIVNGTSAHFASAKEGAEILGSKDAFVERLSQFDRSARMKTDRPVSTAEYLEFVRGNVVEWTDDERARIEAVLAKFRPALDGLKLPLPARVTFIKTTGGEEGNAFYTRGTAIMIPQTQLQKPDAPLEQVIPHELFHVMTRRDPALRDGLYKAIGFTKIREVKLPPELASRRITNPDAPVLEHAIKLKSDGKDVTAVPITYANAATYDVARGGEFFSYLQFGFFPVRSANNVGGEVLKAETVTGFFEQIGRNTKYIIHPEEILAENFAYLVQNRSDLPSPEVLERMRGVLTQRTRAKPKGR